MFKNWLHFLLFAFFILYLIVYTFYFIGSEDKMYTCNFVLANYMYMDIFKVLSTEPSNFLYSFMHYINNLSFNPIQVLPLYPFYMMFGPKSRFGFCLGIQLFYLLPIVYILLRFLYSKLIVYEPTNKLFNIYTIIACLFIPTLHFSALRGFADIIDFIPFFLLILLSLNLKLEEKTSILKILLFSFLIYFIFLIRRYFLSLEISLIITMFSFSLYRLIFIKDNFSIIKLIRLISNLFIIPGLFFISCVYLFQKSYLLESINAKNYVFEAYQMAFSQNINSFISVVGNFNFFLFLILLIPVLFIRDKNKNNFIFMLILTFLYVIFSSNYIVINIFTLFFVISLQLLTIYCLFVLNSFCKEKKVQFFSKLLIFAVLIFNVINFIFYISPSNSKNIILSNLKSYMSENRLISCSLGSMTSYPYDFLYDDLFLEVYNFLFEELKNSNFKANITTFAVLDDVINFYLIQSYSRFNDNILVNHLNPTQEYFNYEAIRLSNLDADYVLVTNPVRHVHVEEGFVPLYYAGFSFINNENIAKSYKKIYETTQRFKNSDDNQYFSIYIYKKVKPVTPQQVSELYDKISEKVPEMSALYDKYKNQYSDYYNSKYN